MNSQLTLRGLRTVAIMAAFAAGLLVGCNASSRADQRADALDKAIPAAMQRASVPGAIVGIWQDGREPYVRAFGWWVKDHVFGRKLILESCRRSSDVNFHLWL